MAGTIAIPNAFAGQAGLVPASQLDANWNTIRDYVNTREVSSGTLAARPNTPSGGTWYFATDDNGGTLYFAASTGWVRAALGLTGSGTLTAPVTLVDATGGGITRPWLAFQETGSETWRVFYQRPAFFGNSATLSFSPITAGRGALQFSLISADGGQRVAVWDSTTTLPNVPHTSIPPTFAVFGDIMAGDIVAIESNPMTYFIRANTGLPETAITQFFSANKAAGVEPDGGAQLILAPFKNGGGAINDGYIQLVAYGGGTGTSANEIQFRQRSGSNTVLTTWRIGGGAEAAFYPNTDRTLDIGTGNNRVRAIYSSEVLVQAGSSSTMCVVPGVLTNATASATGSLANTSENDLKSYTVPADTLTTNGDALRITMTFRFANNATSKQVRIYYGGTVVLDSGASVAFQQGSVEVVLMVYRTAAATVTVPARAVFSGNNQTWVTAVGGATSTSLLAVSNASGNIVKATSQQGVGAAADDVVQDALIVEYLRVK